MKIIIVLISALLVSGCASTPLDHYLAQPPAIVSQAKVESLPFFSQEKNQCGPASLAMVLGWAGEAVDPNALAEQVFTPGKEGSFQMDMVGAARRRGKFAIEVTSFDKLFKEIAAGHPVLVFQNVGFSWHPIWHYAVVHAYDLDDKTLTLHSGEKENLRMSLSSFESSWENAGSWGIVVLPPTELSATADELEHLQAAVAIERGGLRKPALIAYESILKKWPRSLGALIGVGNVRFAEGDAKGSVAALKDATEYHPKSAFAWHNLAFAYAEEKKPRLARSAAKKAIGLTKSESDRVSYQSNLSSLLN